MKAKKLMIGALVGLALSPLAAQAESRTLANLERERASLMNVITDDHLSATDRQSKIMAKQRHLMDLERMAIRDDRLIGSSDPKVQKAFNDYDSTFLVHASAEAKQNIVDFWMARLGLETDAILASKLGRR